LYVFKPISVHSHKDELFDDGKAFKMAEFVHHES
jgi:hypothetical protein